MKSPSTTSASISLLDHEALEAVVGGQQDWGSSSEEDSDELTQRWVATYGVRIYRPGANGLLP